jgi:prepilin-type N-terminal cleavage/methylation domain-containing protein
MTHPVCKSNRGGFTLVELLVVVAIIGILAAIAISQYARYRQDAMESAAKNAYHAVAVAQEAFYIEQTTYATSYADLVTLAGLVIDKNILYGPLTIVLSTDPPSFTFSVNHKIDNSTTYTYSNDGGELIKTGGTRVVVNDSTVP